MIRVLQVVNIMDRAGLETMLMNYYRNIDRSQVQFDFLVHRDTPGAYEDEIKRLGGKIYRAPRLYPQNYLKYYYFMLKFFAEHPEYKIVHSHIDTMSAFPLLAAKKAGVPNRIGHSHSSKLDLDFKFPIKFIAKFLMPYEANMYYACSQKAADFMYPGKKVKIIHNAIDLELFKFDKLKRNCIRKKLNLDDNFVIGHVGRFYYVKNQMFLLDIVHEIKKENSNVRLLLVGKGEDEKILRKRVKDLELEDNVIFLIDRADVNDLYQAMDVFVMPSIFEGLPVVGVEAQANGLPCLFSNTISNEVLLTNQAEMMSLKCSPKEWANRVLNMQREKDEDTRTLLADQGYDIRVEAQKLQKCYVQMYNR